jgi:hypothetical protein
VWRNRGRRSVSGATRCHSAISALHLSISRPPNWMRRQLRAVLGLAGCVNGSKELENRRYGVREGKEVQKIISCDGDNCGEDAPSTVDISKTFEMHLGG